MRANQMPHQSFNLNYKTGREKKCETHSAESEPKEEEEGGEKNNDKNKRVKYYCVRFSVK